MTLNEKGEFSHLELANVGAVSDWLVLLNISFVTCSLFQYIQKNTILKVPAGYIFFNLAVYLDVHIDCDSITGPGLPGRGVPSAQEVLDYIKFKFFKSAGPREPEEVKSGEQNVQSSGATTSLEEECSHVVEPGPQVGHGDSGNERTPSEKLELGEATSSSTPLPLRVGAIEVPSTQDVLNLISDNYTNAINPASREELNDFVKYLQQLR